ncbi:MAG: hypothetical protein AAB490_03530 [Patescibacteria group bacterium]
MHGNARGLKRGLFFTALFLMTAILAMASSSPTIAVIPGAQPSKAKAPAHAAETATAQKSEPEKIQTAHGPVTSPAAGTNSEPRDVAAVAELFPTVLLMRRVFDLNIGAYESELGTPTPETIPVKWPAWEDVYFDRESYRSKLETLVAKDWTVGTSWWYMRVAVACEQELTRGGPILFTLDYPGVKRESLIIEVVKETVREASGEVQRTVILAKQGVYAAPTEGEGRSVTPLILIVVVLGVLAIVLVFLLLNTLLKALAHVFFPDQGENPWVRRFLACCIGAAILIIITVARLAI